MEKGKDELYHIVDTLTQAQHDGCQFADMWICYWMMAQRAAPPDQQQKCADEIEAWSKIRATTYRTYQDMINAALRGEHDFPENTDGHPVRH